MAETWVITEQSDFNWEQIMSSTDYAALKTAFNEVDALHLKESPTQVSETFKKPVFEVDTINGVNIRMTPCAQPGRPLPMVRKVSLRFEHLRVKDFNALKLIHMYDLKFGMATSNIVIFGTFRGRYFVAKMDDFNLEWTALRFGEQVYTINMTCRILQSAE